MNIWKYVFGHYGSSRDDWEAALSHAQEDSELLRYIGDYDVSQSTFSWLGTPNAQFAWKTRYPPFFHLLMSFALGADFMLPMLPKKHKKKRRISSRYLTARPLSREVLLSNIHPRDAWVLWVMHDEDLQHCLRQSGNVVGALHETCLWNVDDCDGNSIGWDHCMQFTAAALVVFRADGAVEVYAFGTDWLDVFETASPSW